MSEADTKSDKSARDHLKEVLVEADAEVVARAAKAAKNPVATAMLVIALMAVFGGLYMLGQAVAADNDETRAKLDALMLQVDALSREIRTLETQQQRAQEQAPDLAAMSDKPAAAAEPSEEKADAPEAG